MKKTKLVTSDDLKGSSYEEMLEKAYGKKGTHEREYHERRIKERAKNLLKDIKEKENMEKENDKKILSKIDKKLLRRKSLGDVFSDRAKKLKGVKVKNGKPKKSNKSIKSAKVLVKRKPKKGITGKVRKGKVGIIRKKNRKK